MKTHKIIISTLALAMGAALAGSVSGTVAWFQYSTRAQAAYIGTSAHCSEALEVRAGTTGSWTTDLSSSAIDGVKVGGTDLEPITTGELGSDAALPATNNVPDFYKNPIYQFTNKSTWTKADSTNYVQFDLYFHVKDVNGASPASYLAKNLYLTDLTIKSVNDNAEIGLSKAVRVHFAAASGSGENVTKTYSLFANDGSASTNVETDVYGNLDLNNNGKFDKGPGYEWDNRGSALVYGDADKQQVAHNASGTSVLASDADPYNITANQGLIGAIPAAEADFKVTVTIWLEGWAKLSDDVAGVDANDDGDFDDAGDTQPVNGAMWADSFIGKKFQVGMRFAVEAHKSTDA